MPTARPLQLPGLRDWSRPPSGSAGFHLQIQAVGPAITAARSTAGEGSPESVAVAGGQEEGPWEGGATGGSFLKIMAWFNCHFKSRYLQGSRVGLLDITRRWGLRERVPHTAPAPPCLLCHLARSKGPKAPTSAVASTHCHMGPPSLGVTASIWPAEGSTAPFGFLTN